MNDLQQIEQLYFQYAKHIDSGEFKEVAALLKNTTLFGPGKAQLAQGENEIFEMYTNLIHIYPDCSTPKTQHLVSNILIEEIDQNLALTSANYTVLQEIKPAQIETIIGGRYKSKFIRKNGAWEFIEHHMIPTIIGNMSRHLTTNIISSEE